MSKDFLHKSFLYCNKLPPDDDFNVVSESIKQRIAVET